MDDPNSRRSPGSWPRDRPIRWGGVVRNLATFLLTTVAVVAQLVLIVPLLALPSGDGLPGVLRIVASLVWAGATLWAGWSWLMGRARGILAPLGTAVVLWFVAAMGS